MDFVYIWIVVMTYKLPTKKAEERNGVDKTSCTYDEIFHWMVNNADKARASAQGMKLTSG